jgi:hypothetical protein
MAFYLRLSQFGLLVLFFASCPLFAQEPHSSCQNMRYEHHNQIDPPPRHVGLVSGIVKDFQGFEVRGACVGIFSEAEQKLLISAEADDKGRFVISGLQPGRYRMVVSAEGLCAANGRIIVKGKSKKNKLTVIMRPSGIDVCSWIAKS